MNFRDFKGNTTEALAKLINDLKKFGSQVAKNLKVEQLAPGFGEEVCHLIDELLNIELYRRDYKFGTPIFPEENFDADDNLNEGDDDPSLHGNQELNGIEIQAQGDKKNLLFSEERGIMSPTTGARRPTLSGKIEETKINFFNAKKHEEQQMLFEKPEEDRIIEARYDPLEWKQEVERIEGDLRMIEKDIELMKQRGVGGGLDEDVEECRRHTELIVELCQDIKRSVHHDVRKVFAKAGEILEDELRSIRKSEQRINQ